MNLMVLVSHVSKDITTLHKIKLVRNAKDHVKNVLVRRINVYFVKKTYSYRTPSVFVKRANQSNILEILLFA